MGRKEAGREGVGGHHEPSDPQQARRLGRSKKDVLASERDEEDRSAWRGRLSGVDSKRLVFVDECSTNVRMVPLLAKAPKGERAFGKAPRNWKENVTLISSISLLSKGMGPSMSIEGSADG